MINMRRETKRETRRERRLSMMFHRSFSTNIKEWFGCRFIQGFSRKLVATFCLWGSQGLKIIFDLVLRIGMSSGAWRLGERGWRRVGEREAVFLQIVLRTRCACRLSRLASSTNVGEGIAFVQEWSWSGSGSLNLVVGSRDAASTYIGWWAVCIGFALKHQYRAENVALVAALSATLSD